jgi:hypothetical protein
VNNANEKVIVIIGDIKNSRQIPDYQETAINLKHELSVINHKENAVLSDFVLTQGDEIEGVLQSADGLFYLIERINRSIPKQSIRFSISVGSLSTDLNRNSPLDSFGIPWNIARDSLLTLEQKERAGDDDSNIILNWETFSKRDEILRDSSNQLVIDACRIRAHWTQDQEWLFSAVLVGTRFSESVKQTEIINLAHDSNRKGKKIYQSNLSRTIKKTSYFDYVHSLTLAERIINLEAKG